MKSIHSKNGKLRIKKAAAIFLAALAVCASGFAVAAPKYKIEKLFDYEPYAGVRINNNGTLAGSLTLGNGVGPTLGFVGNLSTGLSLLSDLYGDHSSHVTAINDAENFVGYGYDNAVTGDGVDYLVNKAFLDTQSDHFEIKSPVAVDADVRPAALNANNVVVGSARGTDGDYHAFQYANGVFTYLAPYEPSGAVGINKTGQIIGTHHVTVININNPIAKDYDRAFIYQNGQLTDLALEDGSNPVAINDAGHIAGVHPVGSNTAAFLYVNGAPRDLGWRDGSAGNSYSATVLGMNNADEVVGYTEEADGSFPFLYSKGKMVDLNKLVELSDGSKAGFTFLSEASAITDSGKILGSGEWTPGGGGAVVYSYFLLTPISTPIEPTLVTKQKSKVTTKVARFAIKGTSKNAVSVKYRVGAGPLKSTKSVGNWSFTAALKIGRNVVTVQAFDEAGKPGAKLTFVITRKRK